METVPRNIILDLLPAYIAGEASNETKKLVEEYAQNDPQIARIIRAGKLENDPVLQKITMPDDLEIKTIKRLRRNVRNQMMYVAAVTATILMIPLVAMQYTNEVNWSPMDFVIMGTLLFGTGLTYVLITKASESILYRAATGIAVLTGLLLMWVNLAVGFIGSENNPANLLYLGVFIVGIAGAGYSRLHPKGMAYTMIAAAIFQMLVPVIALIFWTNTMFENPGIVGVFILNAFFASLFLVSALLFRHAAKKQAIL